MTENAINTVADAPNEGLSSATWWEVWATCSPAEFYDWMRRKLPPGAVLMYHHFYEPWHRGGPVIRLLIAPDHYAETKHQLTLAPLEQIERWAREDDDRELYGDWFGEAMTFFHASSAFVAHPDADYMTDKLIHCFLNARGMTCREEVRWGLRYAWRSAITEPWLWWRALRTGRKWWER